MSQFYTIVEEDVQAGLVYPSASLFPSKVPTKE